RLLAFEHIPWNLKAFVKRIPLAKKRFRVPQLIIVRVPPVIESSPQSVWLIVRVYNDLFQEVLPADHDCIFSMSGIYLLAEKDAVGMILSICFNRLRQIQLLLWNVEPAAFRHERCGITVANAGFKNHWSVSGIDKVKLRPPLRFV